MQYSINKSIEYNRGWLEKVFPGVDLSSIVSMVMELEPPGRVFGHDMQTYAEEVRIKVTLKTCYGGTIETTVVNDNGEYRVASDYNEVYSHYDDWSLGFTVPITCCTTKVPQAIATAITLTQKQIDEQKIIDAGKKLSQLIEHRKEEIAKSNEEIKRNLLKPKKKKPAPIQKVDPFTPGGRKLNLPKPTEN